MSEHEIIEIVNANKKPTRKICRIMWQDFGIEPISANERTIQTISRMCSDLNLDGIIEKKSLFLLEQLKKKSKTISSSPATIAAATIYLSSGKKNTTKNPGTKVWGIRHLN